MSSIAWDDGAPSSDGEPEVRFFSAENQRSTVYVIGGTQRVYTHYVGQTVPCLGDECFHHQTGVPSQLSCFIGIVRVDGFDDMSRPIHKKFLWHIRQNNLNDLGDGPYRGLVFDTWKIDGRALKKINVKRDPSRSAPDWMLERFQPTDVKSLLESKWRLFLPRKDEPAKQEEHTPKIVAAELSPEDQAALVALPYAHRREFLQRRKGGAA